MSIVDTVKQTAQGLVQGAVSKLVPLAPDSWVPGGVPDPLIARQHGLIGTSVSRLDGPLKVKGAARFAAEFALDDMVYAALAFATIPRGRIAIRHHRNDAGRSLRCRHVERRDPPARDRRER